MEGQTAKISERLGEESWRFRKYNHQLKLENKLLQGQLSDWRMQIARRKANWN